MIIPLPGFPVRTTPYAACTDACRSPGRPRIARRRRSVWRSGTPHDNSTRQGNRRRCKDSWSNICSTSRHLRFEAISYDRICDSPGADHRPISGLVVAVRRRWHGLHLLIVRLAEMICGPDPASTTRGGGNGREDLDAGDVSVARRGVGIAPGRRVAGRLATGRGDRVGGPGEPRVGRDGGSSRGR